MNEYLINIYYKKYTLLEVIHENDDPLFFLELFPIISVDAHTQIVIK